MKLPNGLTKDNCFDELMQKYPKAMKIFCNWIDEYKKEVQWDNLFGNYTATGDIGLDSIKFHDIPYDMQVGIWIRFLLAQNDLEAAREFCMHLINYPTTIAFRNMLNKWMSDKDFNNL